MYFSLEKGLRSTFLALIVVVTVGSSVPNAAQSQGISRIETRHMRTLPGMSSKD